ncbi:MAG: MFS transporter, partial [Candidatus Dormibacteria bacterium]
LPHTLYQGLVAQGVPAASATQISHVPAVGSLFASFLGYNPMASLLGPTVLGHLPHAQAANLTGRAFFPHLNSGPYRDGLHAAFDFAVGACFLAAIARWLRGGKYIYDEVVPTGTPAAAPTGPVASPPTASPPQPVPAEVGAAAPTSAALERHPETDAPHLQPHPLAGGNRPGDGAGS